MVAALNELLRILKRNKLANRAVFNPFEVMENSITRIKTVGSGAVIDIAMGTEEGLLCIYLDREGITSYNFSFDVLEFLFLKLFVVCIRITSA